MWIDKYIIGSLWKAVLIVFSVSAVNTKTHKHGKESGLKLQCDPKRVEITFPIITDSAGRKTSKFYAENSPRDLLLINIRWRRDTLHLVLYKNMVTSPGSFSEWEDGNITYARNIDKSCFYHGYIKGQKTSYVALSTCGGLGGFIQTDEELLYIQSRLETDSQHKDAPHLVYTCEPVSRKPTPSRMKSTAGTMRKRRRKRAASRTRYLEVQLVIDHKIVRAIGSKKSTENYVMAIMNIVNTLYQHSSLGQDIRVVVVRIIYLSKHQQRDVVSRGFPLRTVNKFCKWSMDNIPRGRPMNYDISVLITDETLGPSGFAPITGLCNPVRSCAAIHDDGFSTGFVIAHEMAHVFGLFHDGHGNHCHGRKYQTSIMAPVVESRFNHFWWSECSKRRMGELVRYLSCLNNVPVPIENHYSLKATQKIPQDLGKSWSLNFQCGREFGSSFRLCQAFGSDPCSILWCANVRNPHYCRTKRGPPLSGSRCGRDRECHNTRCQYVGNRSPVNGAWGAWTKWTECSSGCGVGTKERTRTCNNPTPMYGGEECKGETQMRGTCFNNKCDTFSDIRAEECRVWDSLQIRRGTHKWLPYEPVNASTQCKQTCRSFYTREIVAIEVDVSDGAPCSYLKNSSDVCIDGVCLAVGCDGVQNSTKKMDACGVCGGDSSECKVIEAVFRKKPKHAHKYDKVIALPVNARNITISKTSTTDHFLAIKDALYGKFILNGNNQQSQSEDMVLKGAMFHYEKGNPTKNESLVSPGPIHGPLEIMVQTKRRGTEIDILFRYTVHKSDMTYEKDRFQWKFSAWSTCSVTCGEGVQKIMHNCVNKQTGQVVDEVMCSALEHPRQDEVKCTRQGCTDMSFNWGMLNSFTECDAKCGKKGFKSQEYVCEQHFPKSNSYVKVDMEYCNHLNPPAQKRDCKGDPCQNEERVTYDWNSEKWSKCQSIKKCGMPGHKTRVVKCITIRSNRKMTREVVDDSKCNIAAKPAETEMCPAVPCPDKYRWFTDQNWSKCPCGGVNIQKRKVACQQIKEVDGKEVIRDVERQHCKKLGGKPAFSRKCNGGPCPPTFRWVNSKSDFEPCDAECDEKGKEIAKLVCQQVVVWKKKEIIETVDGSFCKSEKKPKEKSKVCNGPSCVPVYRWKATDEWTPCTAKCDEEVTQYRIYKCQKSIKSKPFSDVGNHLCSNIKKDNDTKQCKGPLCPLKWQMGEYSECSVTCGRGKKYRTVYCGDPETDSDDIRCTDDPPSTSKRCALKWCPEPNAKECKDAFSFCSFYSGLAVRCKDASFLQKCCKTCEPHTKQPASRSRRRVKNTSTRKSSHSKKYTKRQLRHRNRKRRSRRSRKLRKYKKR